MISPVVGLHRERTTQMESNGMGIRTGREQCERIRNAVILPEFMDHGPTCKIMNYSMTQEREDIKYCMRSFCIS